MPGFTTLPQYMQQAPDPRLGPVRSTQRGTRRSGPQPMSKLLEIFNQMPQFKGIGEEEIRRLFAGSIASARLFGQGQGRISRGERGAAPMETAGVEAQKRARLARDIELPMLKAIMQDKGMEKSFLARLYEQLMGAATGPESEESNEGTSYYEPRDERARVVYPSQGAQGSSLARDDWWDRTGPPEYPGGGGGGGGTFQEPDQTPYRGSFRLPRVPQPPEEWWLGGTGPKDPDEWPTSPENPPGGGPSPLPEEPGEDTSAWFDPGTTGTSRRVSRKDYLANPAAYDNPSYYGQGKFGAWS